MPTDLREEAQVEEQEPYELPVDSYGHEDMPNATQDIDLELTNQNTTNMNEEENMDTHQFIDKENIENQLSGTPSMFDEDQQ